jgi:threonyl-tRNA synthetase
LFPPLTGWLWKLYRNTEGLLFKERTRSYKELPLRFADFGVLHRNEASGSLTGLTRVRRFQQDDAHIFCTPDMIEDEMAGGLDFLSFVYAKFGFTFELNLSTRPKKFLGDPAIWDMAEQKLKNSLDTFGQPWEYDKEGGAFYGPKIDIKIKDALGRQFQCATIQLDFQLPIRFDLEYTPSVKNADGSKSRPVIVHRAILGSVERMIAILTENYAGKFPFWLSPRQMVVIPAHPEFNDYAKKVALTMTQNNFTCDTNVDDSLLLKKKIAVCSNQSYIFLLVVGKAEMESNSVAVRGADGKPQGVRTMDEVLAHLGGVLAAKTDDCNFPEGPVAVAAAGGAPAAIKGAGAAWDSAEVGAWLGSNNLGQYAEIFASNGITGLDLGDLCHDDLASMGVLKAHDRKEILRCAASL